MSRPLRIAFVGGSAALGGAELSLSELVRPWMEHSTVFLFEDGPFRELLESRGMRVEVVPLARSAMENSKESGIPGIGAIAGIGSQVARLARRLRSFDLVHCNNQKGWIVGSMAAALARRPSIYHLRDQLDREHFSRTKIRIAIWTANRLAGAVVCNSRSTAEVFRKSGGRADLTRVLYNPIQQAPFLDAVPIPGFRDPLRCGDEPVYGILSRLAHWKGQHVALEALASMPRGHLVLVGSPFFGEEPYEAHLRDLASRLGIADRVHFLGFRPDVPAILASIDGLLHTSIAPEPFGRVVLEGLLSGKPVVATDAGGVPELIDPGRTGWLVPMADPIALARVLRSWQEQPMETARVAAAGREDSLRTFAPDALHARFRDIVASLVAPD